MTGGLPARTRAGRTQAIRALQNDYFSLVVIGELVSASF